MSDKRPEQKEPPEEFDGGPSEFQLPVPSVSVVGGHPDASAENPFEDMPELEDLDTGADPDADPSLELRRILGMFATGVTIITTEVGGQVHGMTANAFMSVSLKPPLVVVGVDRRSKMHRMLHVGRSYGVNVLSEDQGGLSDRFAGRPKAAGPDPTFELIRATPLIEGAIAHLVARVEKTYWGGDHALFLGRVEHARWGTGQPLLFHQGRYQGLLSTEPPPSPSGHLLEALRAVGTERTFSEGEVVISEGEQAQELFVILAGTARVERGGRMLQRHADSGLLGEGAVLEGHLRRASVVADTNLRCAVVSREALKEALGNDSEATWAMIEFLAGRLGE
ncbi:MAG: flavin reductase [Actinobacteria bacterium]|jgi:flavin reductase (DIM6/NTAB) family NADH-FMN oxidoreductase RutF|nr:flavin reductase [Actinomycetota bacterium]MDQ3218706.1 flavin reductase [Actinomycetota bacterium]